MSLIEFLPSLFKGAYVTIQLTILSLVIGLVIGLILALFKLSNVKILNYVSAIYVSAFRGTPLLVQLMIIYFALPEVGLKFTAFESAIIGLSLNEAAYMAEIFRGGIQSVPKGQTEAAKAIGMNTFRAYQRIILPQAIKIALPPMGNSAIILLKNTSLAAVITVGELMHRGELLADTTFRTLEIYIMVAVIYWVLHYPLTLLVKYLERRNRGGEAS